MDLENMNKENSYDIASRYSSVILSEYGSTPNELLAAIQGK